MSLQLRILLEGPREDGDDFLFGQGSEGEDLHPGKEGRHDLEGGVFRGGADENDLSALHVGEKGVLLELVEPVKFVDEEDHLLELRLLDDLLHFLDPYVDRGKGDEGEAEVFPHEKAEGGLSDP